MLALLLSMLHLILECLLPAPVCPSRCFFLQGVPHHMCSYCMRVGWQRNFRLSTFSNYFQLATAQGLG